MNFLFPKNNTLQYTTDSNSVISVSDTNYEAQKSEIKHILVSVTLFV